MKCPRCGADTTEGPRFCDLCGAPLEVVDGSQFPPAVGTPPKAPELEEVKSLQWDDEVKSFSEGIKPRLADAHDRGLAGLSSITD